MTRTLHVRIESPDRSDLEERLEAIDAGEADRISKLPSSTQRITVRVTCQIERATTHTSTPATPATSLAESR
ncbi:uncharacterized protein Hqrw_3467 [Haloquadratum walsbyi C23]|uniref:Uncharacterized protein n=1 Tax=Haloquadratum walsbyi (strain DSM 16854 / JCM 12705 / C23) TaxID=768065 RepID=G0LMA7_HALWC|nr:uncharacterized protein Hqrw_3467 [Haloquadratum walsbyi C23]